MLALIRQFTNQQRASWYNKDMFEKQMHLN